MSDSIDLSESETSMLLDAQRREFEAKVELGDFIVNARAQEQELVKHAKQATAVRDRAFALVIESRGLNIEEWEVSLSEGKIVRRCDIENDIEHKLDLLVERANSVSNSFDEQRASVVSLKSKRDDTTVES